MIAGGVAKCQAYHQRHLVGQLPDLSAPSSHNPEALGLSPGLGRRGSAPALPCPPRQAHLLQQLLCGQRGPGGCPAEDAARSQALRAGTANFSPHRGRIRPGDEGRQLCCQQQGTARGLPPDPTQPRPPATQRPCPRAGFGTGLKTPQSPQNCEGSPELVAEPA